MRELSTHIVQDVKGEGIGVRAALWRDLLWIAALGLVVQAFWAARLEHPSYFDAYYYTTNAQRLAAGEGFTQEIVWQYLDNPTGLPTASHTYWMPLASLLGAVGYMLLDSFRGAQLPFWLLAALLPLMGYAISWRLTQSRWQARMAALLTMAGGYYTAYWVQPSTFALYAWAGGGGLLALAYATTRPPFGARIWYWALAGVAAGLAHLTRADGILLLLVGVWLWLLDLIRVLRGPAEREVSFARMGARLALLVGAYLITMAPWFYRTWQISGSPLSSVGTQTIFLTTYDDVFAFGRSFDLSSYLAWGWRNILLSKLEAAWLALQTFVAVTGLTAFVVFMLAGWKRKRQEPSTSQFLRPFGWYTLALFVSMSLVFTFPGQRGSLLHSSTAVWPWSMALVPAGVDAIVDWIAVRRPAWRPEQAKRFFTVTLVILALVISFFVASGQPLRQDEAALFRQIAEIVPPDAVIMTGDPPGFHYHTGLKAVMTPNEPPEIALEVARQFGVTYLFLDPGHPLPFAAFSEGEQEIPGLQLEADFGDGFQLYRLAP